jgi:NAD(P)-dependent dehydrogenase (short-subunit alcohol dehydrogenase family)
LQAQSKPEFIALKGKIVHIKDTVAFVTGANRGLGLALAQELLARGAKKVYAGVRNPSDTEPQLPGLEWVKLDVTDRASVAAAAAQCADTTLLVNNAGIARLTSSTLDPAMIETTREILETNFFGLIRATQAFAPIVKANGGGAIVNVLSDAAWFALPMLASYASTKSAAWSYTNALRVESRANKIQVLALHVGFMDTDMTKGFDMAKTSPKLVASRTFDALEAGKEEISADEGTQAIKQSLSSEQPFYLNPPALA